MAEERRHPCLRSHVAPFASFVFPCRLDMSPINEGLDPSLSRLPRAGLSLNDNLIEHLETPFMNLVKLGERLLNDVKTHTLSDTVYDLIYTRVNRLTLLMARRVYTYKGFTHPNYRGEGRMRWA